MSCYILQMLAISIIIPPIDLHPHTHTFNEVSNDPMNRLRCHNGELKQVFGYGWKHVCIIESLDRTAAIQFQHANKKNPHHP